MGFLRFEMKPSDQAGLFQLREIAEAVVKDNFLELFDFTVRPQGKKLILTVVLDKKSGAVTLDDCTQTSRDLEKRLDELDLIQTPYLLEVSSPGLDRPLRNLDDCLRFKGSLAHFVTQEPVEGQTSFRGQMVEVQDGKVELLVEGGKKIWLAFESVKTARLIVEF